MASRKITKLLKKTLLKAPFACRHFEVSLIDSRDDAPGAPSDRLLDLSMKSVNEARSVELPDVSSRVPGNIKWPDIWPGEHYRLLAGMVRTLQPKTIVEIGTYTGLSSLAMESELPEGSKLVTFDVLPWDTIPHTHLVAEDFVPGRLEQVIADLADPQEFRKHAELLQSADMIFVDGPKNVTFEEEFLTHLNNAKLPQNPVVVFDDIRLWNMLKIWREISHPKLDLTSFGHWSGTGLVDWNPAAEAGRVAA